MLKNTFTPEIIDLYENTYYKNNFHEFIKLVDTKRANAFNDDNSLLKDNSIIYDINNIDSLSEGRFSVICNNVEFECLLRKKKSDKLYVVLSAGVSSSSVSQPQFNRWTYGKQLDGNILNIADPMYRKFPNLLAGWYFGTKEENYLDYLVNIIKVISEKLLIKKEHITFLGSSSAGYASIYCGCHIAKSTVMVFNPQIAIPQHLNIGINLKNTLSLDFDIEDKYGRFDLCEKIKYALDTKFIFFENARSFEDVQQISHLADCLNFKFKYGINTISDKMIIWVYDAEGFLPHNEQDYLQLLMLLQELFKQDFTENWYKDISIYINELWHERFSVKHSKDIANKRLARSIIELPISYYAKNFKAVPSINIPELVIKAENNIWNQYLITKSLSPNTIYKLNIKNSSVLSGSTDKFSIVIRDIYLNYPTFVREYDISSEVVLFFVTSGDCTHQELRIYPGTLGQSQNISIYFDNITLSELSFE